MRRFAPIYSLGRMYYGPNDRIEAPVPLPEQPQQTEPTETTGQGIAEIPVPPEKTPFDSAIKHLGQNATRQAHLPVGTEGVRTVETRTPRAWAARGVTYNPPSSAASIRAAILSAPVRKAPE